MHNCELSEKRENIHVDIKNDVVDKEIKTTPRLINKFVDFMFSNDYRKWVFLIFIFGFLLRTFLSYRIEFGADEIVYGTQALDFIESEKLQNMSQSSAWFFLEDLFIKILGNNLFGFRFFSILLGSLSIILIYLLGEELFNKKIGLISSFIFAISPLQLLQTFALMDIPMAFYSLFAMYLTILFFKTDKKIFFFFSWLALGIAIMIKSIALLFVPPFLIFYLYYNKRYNGSFKFNQIILASLIILIMVLPVLTFNYLLFKDKGITDIQFARFTQKGLETYEGIANTATPFTLERAFIHYDDNPPGIILGLYSFYHQETIVFILAIIGLIFLFCSKTRFKFLYILSFLFPYIFLSGTSLLQNHLVFGSFFTIQLASLTIYQVSSFFKNEKFRKYFICFILILILLFVSYRVKIALGTNDLFTKHHMEQLIEFKEDYMDKNSLVVVDSRIYRGRIVFMFNDRHYLEASYFPQLINEVDQFPGGKQDIKTYFIEAATDDSGWGTIQDQLEFNESMEDIVSFFKLNSRKIQAIKDIWGNDHFNVYETTIPLKSSVLNYADSTHIWFYYPVGYKPVESNFDYYELYNSYDTILDKLAHLILYLEIFLAISLIFYICYRFYKTS